MSSDLFDAGAMGFLDYQIKKLVASLSLRNAGRLLEISSFQALTVPRALHSQVV